MRKIIASFAVLILAGIIETVSAAQGFGRAPRHFEAETVSFIKDRLDSRVGARISVDNSPYQVYADFDGHDEMPAWAVDVQVRAKLPSFVYGCSEIYTVVFVDGEPVALAYDEVDIRSA